MQRGAILVTFLLAFTTARPGDLPKLIGGGSVGYVRLSIPPSGAGVFLLPANSNSYPASIGLNYDVHIGATMPFSSDWWVGGLFYLVKGAMQFETTEPTLFNVGGEPTPGTFRHTLDFDWTVLSPSLMVEWIPSDKFTIDVLASFDFPTSIYGRVTESIADPDGVTYTNGDTSRIRIDAEEPTTAAFALTARFVFNFPVTRRLSLNPFISVRQQITSIAKNSQLYPTTLSLGVDVTLSISREHDETAARVDTARTPSPDTSVLTIDADTVVPASTFIATAIDVSLQTSQGTAASSVRIFTKRKLILTSSPTDFENPGTIGDQGIVPTRTIVDTVIDADPPQLIVHSHSVADAGFKTGLVTGMVQNETVWRESWLNDPDTAFVWELRTLPGNTLMLDTLELILQSTATDNNNGTAHSLPKSVVLNRERMGTPFQTDSISFVEIVFDQTAFESDSLSPSGRGLVNAFRPLLNSLINIELAGPKHLVDILRNAIRVEISDISFTNDVKVVIKAQVH